MLSLSGVYYNENDPQKVAWLRELINQNVIAPGEIDERSISDVDDSDIRGFTQCHFFAGIGVWSYALRLAGWPDDRPVWTGSCPCPSFSAAGKGGGFNDPRHLWPAWARLIGECRPATIFGEQADDAIGYGWLDLVQTDLERAEYAVGKAVLGACSVGAPHIRQRVYFVGQRKHSAGDGLSQRRSEASFGTREQEAWEAKQRLSDAGNGLQPDESGLFAGRETSEAVGYWNSVDAASSTSEHHDAERNGWGTLGNNDGTDERLITNSDGQLSFDSQPLSPRIQRHLGDVRDWRGPGWLNPHTARSVAEAGATRGFWGDCDWWHARDEKYRPIEPGIFPLAHGASSRVLKLRGFGDAIVPQVAAQFIQAANEALISC